MYRLFLMLVLAVAPAAGAQPLADDAPTSTTAELRQSFRKQIDDIVALHEVQLPRQRENARRLIAELDVPDYTCSSSDLETLETLLRFRDNPCTANQEKYLSLVILAKPNDALAMFQTADLNLDPALSMYLLSTFLNVNDARGYWETMLWSPAEGAKKPKITFDELRGAFIRLVEKQPDGSLATKEYPQLVSYFINDESAALLERKGNWSGGNAAIARDRLFGE